MSSDAATTGREQRVLEIIETARSKRARFRDEQITLAHGAGGKATQTLIEGLLVPAFDNGVLSALADAGVVAARRHPGGDDLRQLRRQAAPLPRRIDR